jgi:flagella basal body P-ring formation protein FlgA
MWRLLILMLPTAALADSVVATRTIRAQSVIVVDDLTTVAAEIPGALDNVAAAVGNEARVAIYAGRPVSADQIGPPAVVGRNEVVALVYATEALAITTEWRALARGAAGDVIRVMNLSSRTTVTGRVAADGSVVVEPNR